MKAVILAGGKGTRLKPYSTFVPKPLMPIGDMPIIEVVLKQLKRAGVERITMAVGHMAQLIQAFVGDGGRFGLEITYSFETEPMGTAGPLSLMREELSREECFIVMNGDVLTTLDYGRALAFHKAHGGAATICVNARQVPVDFGVIVSDAAGQLSEYREKPVLSYDVSMGVNIFSGRALASLPEGTFFNIPDLMLKLRAEKQKVMCYREDCYWLDIGRVEDYALACEEFERRRWEFFKE
jgi:NDP-sugar pyrophosphorylase family protein